MGKQSDRITRSISSFQPLGLAYGKHKALIIGRTDSGMRSAERGKATTKSQSDKVKQAVLLTTCPHLPVVYWLCVQEEAEITVPKEHHTLVSCKPSKATKTY